MKKMLLTVLMLLAMATGAMATDPLEVRQITRTGCADRPELLLNPPCADQPLGVRRTSCEISYVDATAKRLAQEFGQVSTTYLSTKLGIQKQVDWATITRSWMTVSQQFAGNRRYSNTAIWLAGLPFSVQSGKYSPFGYIYVRAKLGGISTYGIASLLNVVQSEIPGAPHLPGWKAFATAFYTGNSTAMLNLIMENASLANDGEFGSQFAQACNGVR